MEENQRVTISKRMLRDSLLRLLESKELSEINITELCREAKSIVQPFINTTAPRRMYCPISRMY